MGIWGLMGLWFVFAGQGYKPPLDKSQRRVQPGFQVRGICRVGATGGRPSVKGPVFRHARLAKPGGSLYDFYKEAYLYGYSIHG